LYIGSVLNQFGLKGEKMQRQAKKPIDLSVKAASTSVLQIKKIKWYDESYYRVMLLDGSVLYYDAVTFVISQASPKPWLAPWYGDIGTQEAIRRATEAKDRGSLIHQACYVWEKGGIVAYRDPFSDDEDSVEGLFPKNRNVIWMPNQDHQRSVEKFQAFFETTQPEILAMEETVYSHLKRVAGTLDRVYRFKGGEYPLGGQKPVVIPEGIGIADIKTGKESDDWLVQLGQYYSMWIEMGRGNIDFGMVIHLDADTRAGLMEGLKVHLYTPDQLIGGANQFDHLLATHRWKGAAKPKTFEFQNVLYRKDLIQDKEG
jgi:hypothetical protein